LAASAAAKITSERPCLPHTDLHLSGERQVVMARKKRPKGTPSHGGFEPPRERHRNQIFNGKIAASVQRMSKHPRTSMDSTWTLAVRVPVPAEKQAADLTS